MASDRGLRHPGHRAPPAGVDDGEHPGAGVDQDQGDAVGDHDRQPHVRAGGDQCVGLDRARLARWCPDPGRRS